MAEIRLLPSEALAAREQPRPSQSGLPRSPERTRSIEVYKAALQQAEPGQG